MLNQQAELPHNRTGKENDIKINHLSLLHAVIVSCVLWGCESGNDSNHYDDAFEKDNGALEKDNGAFGKDNGQDMKTTLPGNLLSVGFDDAPIGKANEELIEELFLNEGAQEVKVFNGVDEGRVEIVGGSQAYQGRALQVAYPKGGAGSKESGAQWRIELAKTYQELYVAYHVLFDAGFDFRRGGKLPGFTGGENTTGCGATTDEGFSTRIMWRGEDDGARGRLVQYIYHVDRGSCGDDYVWNKPSTVYISKNSWHTLETRVVLNTPGVRNGVVEAWFDGVKAADYRDIQYRSADNGSNIEIDNLYFSTFHGGNSSKWAPKNDSYLLIDDITISTQAITH